MVDRQKRFGRLLRPPGQATTALLVLLALIATGCGQATPSSITPPRPSAAPVATTAATQAAPTTAADNSASALTHRYTFRLSRPGGYSFSGNFAFGSPLHIDEAVASSEGQSFAANEACNPNPSADAAIPAIASLTNTTSGFSAEGRAEVASSLESPPVMEVAYYFQGGAMCGGLAANEGWSTGELQPGQSSTQLIMLYIKNYYSPANPAGDQTLLARCRLGIGGGRDKNGNGWALESLRGPHVTGSVASGYEITMTP